jgi:hypothetical protein
MGDSSLTLVLTMLPMLVAIGFAIFFVALAVRLVKAVERIADRLS